MTYTVNPNSPTERKIEADFFKIEGEYAWFFKDNDQVVSIHKTKFIDRIDSI
jgi:hypothetical protein